MIRMIPIDTTRLETFATGTVSPVPVFVEMPDGSRRPDPNGAQAKDEAGTLLWTVDALVSEDDENSEVIGVQLPAPQKPVLRKFHPVQFHGLALRASLNKKTNQVRQYWSANGLAEQRHQGKPEAQAA